MNVAGVRLAEGELVWVDAGELKLDPQDRVLVSREGRTEPGIVFVGTGQLLRRPTEVAGRVEQVLPVPEEAEPSITFLPLPPLGSRVALSSGGATVTRIDPVKDRVELLTDDGATVEVAAEELRSDGGA